MTASLHHLHHLHLQLLCDQSKVTRGVRAEERTPPSEGRRVAAEEEEAVCTEERRRYCSRLTFTLRLTSETAFGGANSSCTRFKFSFNTFTSSNRFRPKNLPPKTGACDSGFSGFIVYA